MKESSFIKNTDDFSKNIKLNLIKKIIAYEDISSTNILARKFGQKGASEGTIVISRTQKSGKGRFDRIWESPEGGLYFSIILKPNCPSEKTTLLPLVASLAVSKAVEDIGLASSIKWPNDVRIKDKKVAGILLESKGSSRDIDYVIIGIGVNLNINVNSFSKQIQPTSTSLLNELGTYVDYYVFLKKLLINLDKYYKTFQEGNYRNIIEEWKSNSDTIGKKVEIQTSSELIEGKAIGIDQSGFLIIQTELGENKKISSGDCRYIK